MLAGRDKEAMEGQRLAIDECVENVPPVLLDEVVDVAKDTAVGC